MKKKFLIFIGIISIFLLSGCSATKTTEKSEIKERRRVAMILEESISQVLIVGESTQSDVTKLLGKSVSGSLKSNGDLRMAYYSGVFYHNNTEKNKKILEKYIPRELLDDKKTLEKIVLGIFLRSPNGEGERVVYKISGETLNY